MCCPSVDDRDVVRGAPTPATPVARIGLISDTHGDLPSAVHTVFAGVDAIVHAGDIGGEAILLELEAIAPVTAVLGNTDRPLPGRSLGGAAELDAGGVHILVTHDARELRSMASRSGASVIVTGHTHRPEVVQAGEALHVNPGSAARPRQADGRGTVALLDIGVRGDVSVRIVPLNG